MSWKSAFRNRRSSNYSYQPHYARQQRSARGKLLYKLGLFSFLGVLSLFLLLVVVLPIFALNLPSPDKLMERDGYSTKIYDRNGVLLYDIFSNQQRTPVSLSQIPENLKEATVAIEDKNFYKHEGFDIFGILRGLSRQITEGRAQGGSTITQQLTKNVLLSSDRSVIRKIKEFVLAVQIEKKYTKDEILQMYLNEVPYGGTAVGVGAASEIYFGKPVSEVSLVEAAVLAGLPQRPTSYSPYGSDPKSYIGRAATVLKRMREDGDINREQEEQAVKELPDLKFAGKGASFKAPHFVNYVRTILEERYGTSLVEQGGLKVTTSLDWELQEKAQTIVHDEIEKIENLHITNGAAVVVDPQTGEILIMVGSKDFNDPDYDGQVNVATSLRQPGSSIKPVTYVTGLKKGYTASTLIMDVPTVFPGGIGQPDYKPISYDGKYRGPIQVRYALANSLNIPAVKMLALVGVQEMLRTASDLGIKTLEPTRENLQRFGLSVTLGGGEVRLLDLTQAYSAFANGGLKHEPISILKVEDQKGKVLEENKPDDGRKVIDPGQAFIISDILSDNEARSDVFGRTSYLVVPGRQVAVKTGTTNDLRDNWTVGWTPQVVVGVWVGNNDNSPMKKVASGVTGASPIWRKIIGEALRDKPNQPFVVPDNVGQSDIDSVSGYQSHDGFPVRKEYYIKGTEPAADDPIHQNLKICKNGAGLATPSQVAGNDYETREFIILKENDPTAASGGENRWQVAIDDWLNSQGDSKYRPPKEFCGASNPLNVEFVKPKDHDRVDSNNVEIKIDPQSTSQVVQVEVEVDGVKQAALTSPPWGMTLNLKNGPHEIRAKAKDKESHESDRRIKIGVNSAWDSASPIP